MPTNQDENFDFSYHRLLYFMSRQGVEGYVFSRADDARFIPKISTDLIKDLAQKGVVCRLIFLQKDSDEPLMYQIEKAAEDAGALIVANLYDIVDNTEAGRVRLTELNFGREDLWKIGKPILFWADGPSMNVIANHAPDLFSQRRHTTVHFTGMVDVPVAGKLNRDGWETFLSSQEFKDIETNISILEKRLKGAREGNYPVVRTVNEIVLPLAKDYAQLGLAAEAQELLREYEAALTEFEDDDILQLLAHVYYALHDYENAIRTLEKANDLIAAKVGNNMTSYPEKWYDNLIDIVHLSSEIGKSVAVLPQLKEAMAVLVERGDNSWSGGMQAAISNLIGDTLKGFGDLLGAKGYYERGLKMKEQLATANPYSELLQRDLSVSCDRLGDTLKSLGMLPEARAHYERGLKMREHLAVSNPQSELFQRDLSISFDRLGDTLSSLGNLPDAKRYYEHSLEIARNLVKANPHSEQLQRDLGIAFDKLGDTLTYLDNWPDAKENYECGLKIRKQLVANNPNSEQLKRDLGISFNNFGDMLSHLEYVAEAKEYYERGLRITEQLIESNPQSEQLQRDLGISFNRLGYTFAALGNVADGRAYYERCLKLVEQLLKVNPHSELLQRDLSLSYLNIARMFVLEGDSEKAVIYFQNSLKILERLSTANPSSQQLKDDIAWVKRKIEELSQ